MGPTEQARVGPMSLNYSKLQVLLNIFINCI